MTRTGLLAVLSPLALAACDDAPENQEASPRAVATRTVERASGAETRYLPGVVRAIDRAPVSFDVGGTVKSVGFEIGERFAEGATIAALDASDYELALEEAQARLAEAEATLEEARADFQRQAKLYDEGWVSKAGYDRALADRESAESRFERLQSTVELAREDLRDTELKAPYAGTVARRHVEPAQRVAAGEPIYDIRGDGGGVEVEVAVPETLIDRVERGSVHEVTFPARPGLTLEGEVSDIAGEATRANAFTATLTVLEAPEAMRTGLTAEVALGLAPAEDTEGALSVPVAALVAGPDAAKSVFVVEDGRARRRAVEVARTTEDTAFVTDGLEPGERVVTRGAGFLHDGRKVRRLDVGPVRYNP